jgi:hypothetical protein
MWLEEVWSNIDRSHTSGGLLQFRNHLTMQNRISFKMERRHLIIYVSNLGIAYQTP